MYANAGDNIILFATRCESVYKMLRTVWGDVTLQRYGVRLFCIAHDSE